ncbi:ribonuclease T2 family protein [Halomonas sp. GXIMD04776]|uniref:ribonuclease T2 family protein n=1 Tax=Halomonas sp. GXIMD04776 TaxID=3415605 RepID=UPI003C975D2F
MIKRVVGSLAVMVLLVLSGPAPARSLLEVDGFDHYVLALTWHPGFCQTVERPREECRISEQRTKARETVAQGFVLHGLWPSLPQRLADDGISPRRWREEGCFLEQPRANGSFCRAHAPFAFAEPFASELDDAMPGRASCLDRYQYAKHAACLALPAEDYFATAVDLMEKLNASTFVDFMMINSGGEISRNALIDVFEAAFGQGTGRALSLKCDGRGKRILTEVRIGIAAEHLEEFPAAKSLVPLRRGRCAPLIRLVTTP